jgi:hypothetical protein
MCDRSHLSQPRQHLLRVLNFLNAEEVFHKHVFQCGVKVAFFMETEERRQRGRHSPSEGCPCVKTGELGAHNAMERALPARAIHRGE